MSQFLKSESFDEMQAVLAKQFIDKDESKIVASQAKLDVTKIAFSDKAFNCWDSILSQAEIENKVGDLLKSAIRQSGGNDSLEKYKRDVESGNVFEPDLFIRNNGYKNSPPVMLMIYHERNEQKCNDLMKQFYIPEHVNEEIRIKTFRRDILLGVIEAAEVALLEEADIIVPIISPDFFDPQKKYLTYVRTAIEQNKTVVPVLLEKCLYSRIKVLKDYLTLPISGRFISEYDNEELGFAEVAEGIQNILS